MNTRLALSMAVPALFAAAVAACSVTPTNAGDLPRAGDEDASVVPSTDTGTGVVAPPGQLALAVVNTRRGASGAAKGLVEVKLTLANGAGGASALTNPVLFKLKGSDGVAVTAGVTPAVYIQGTACNLSGEVTASASYTCVVTFQIADGAAPVEVSYTDPADGRTATAKLSVEPCVTCGAICTYLDADKENCGKCGVSESRGGGWACKAGVPTCRDAKLSVCNNVCVDTRTDKNHCGRCGNRLPQTLECVAGAGNCGSSDLALCGASCVYLKSDSKNCGACGKRCAKPGAPASSCFGDAPLTTPACVADIEVPSVSDCRNPACVAAGMSTAVYATKSDGKVYCRCSYAPI